ncbi:MAG: tetratricopeptide repeat protein [Pseudomonadota bacterium]|nr:tetratricopeptide repeat protein [Pseudomonadota bacterium]
MPKEMKFPMSMLMRATGAAVFALSLLVAQASAEADLKEPTLAETIAGSTLSGSYLAAQIAAKDNDDPTAVAFYERAVALDPENEELKHALFLALAANGRIADAVVIGRKLPQTGPQGSVIRLVLAVEALRQKSWSKTVDMMGEPSGGGDLDRVIQELLSAWATFGSGETVNALRSAREIEGPDWVKVIGNYHAGLIASAAGNDADAETLFKEATKNELAAAVLSETFLRALEALVRTQSRLGKIDDARETLDKGMRLLPSHPPFTSLSARLGDSKPLAPLVASAQQGAAELFYDVGSAISRQGGAPFAQNYLQLAGYLHPGSDAIAMGLAGVFEKQKNHERANSYYQQIDEQSPYKRLAMLEYALNLNQLEQSEEALTILRGLVEDAPDDFTTQLTLGAVLSQHEKYSEAAKVCDTAVERLGEPSDNDWKLFYRRGIAYERLKEWDKAEPNFKKALELSPNQPDVLNYLGYSWIDMGINLEEGMEMIRKAVELKPRSGFIVDSLGWAHYRLGEYEDAVRELERAVELMPQDPVVNDHLGDAYWKVGRKLEATFQWNHALAAEPELDDEAKIRAKLEKGLVENGPETADGSQ